MQAICRAGPPAVPHRAAPCRSVTLRLSLDRCGKTGAWPRMPPDGPEGVGEGAGGSKNDPPRVFFCRVMARVSDFCAGLQKSHILWLD